jgi:hypothetical protein
VQQDDITFIILRLKRIAQMRATAEERNTKRAE